MQNLKLFSIYIHKLLEELFVFKQAEKLRSLKRMKISSCQGVLLPNWQTDKQMDICTLVILLLQLKNFYSAFVKNLYHQLLLVLRTWFPSGSNEILNRVIFFIWHSVIIETSHKFSVKPGQEFAIQKTLIQKN